MDKFEEIADAIALTVGIGITVIGLPGLLLFQLAMAINWPVALLATAAVVIAIVTAWANWVAQGIEEARARRDLLSYGPACQPSRRPADSLTETRRHA